MRNLFSLKVFTPFQVFTPILKFSLLMCFKYHPVSSNEMNSGKIRKPAYNISLTVISFNIFHFKKCMQLKKGTLILSSKILDFYKH
eukprot:UN09008